MLIDLIAIQIDQTLFTGMIPMKYVPVAIPSC